MTDIGAGAAIGGVRGAIIGVKISILRGLFGGRPTVTGVQVARHKIAKTLQ
jgi:hypothetical protein